MNMPNLPFVCREMTDREQAADVDTIQPSPSCSLAGVVVAFFSSIPLYEMDSWGGNVTIEVIANEWYSVNYISLIFQSVDGVITNEYVD